MAFTQTDLDRIDRAIATGTLKVVVDGQEITYRSIDELVKARNLVSQLIASGSATSGGNRSSWRFRITE